MYITKDYRILLVSLLILSSASLAQNTTVYRQTLPDGTVVFSDQPESGSTPIEVKPVTTVPAIKVEPKTNKSLSSEKTKSIYSDFRIASPENNSAQWSGNGAIQVSLSSSPSLLPGHQVSIFVDNKLHANGPSMSYTLTGIERGTHKITASIHDATGKQVASTGSSFTLHRPTVNP